VIELYSFPTPNGHKVSIALEELGAEYRVVPINIMRDEQFWPEFLEISPNNRIPAIVDLAPEDGGAPLPVFESGAILVYLARKHGALLPEDVRGETVVMQWLMWQMANFGPMLGQLGHFRRFAPEPVPYAIGRYAEEAARLYGLLDARLQDREWICDAYSIADIATAPWVSFRGVHEIDLADYPAVRRWYEAFSARPAVVRGVAAGSDVWGDPPLEATERGALFLRRGA
jgi:GST-like protein